MKKSKKRLAIIMTIALMAVFAPTAALAADSPDSSGSGDLVMVTVSNITYDGGPWTGELFTTYVELTSGMTLGDAVQAACDEQGITVKGATTGYITEINGLAEKDGGAQSCWGCSVNNWFNVDGYSQPAEAGDWISVQYSMDWYADLGSYWDSNVKTLQDLQFDSGTLAPDFAPDVHDYKLTLPAGTEDLFVLPLASNFNFQVRTSVDGKEYKLMDGVPVKDGTVLTITCGDPSWPSMNNGYGGAENVPAEVYHVTIAMEEAVVDDNGGGDVDNNGGDNGGGDVEATAEMDQSPATGDSDMSEALAAPIMVIALAGVALATTLRRRSNQ